MNRPRVFICPGCREALAVLSAPPPTEEGRSIVCPAVECSREIWATRVDERLTLATMTVPDLSTRYSIDQRRLLDNGQEVVALMSGDIKILHGLRFALSNAGLEDWEVAGFIREFIQSCPGATWAPGPGLIRSGELEQRRKRELAHD